MKSFLVFLVLIAFGLPLHAKTLVTINEKVKIESEEVDNIFKNALFKQGVNPETLKAEDPQIATFKKNILDNLVKRELIYISAIKDAPKDLDKKVNDELKNLKLNFKDEIDYKNYLTNMKVDENSIIANIKKNIVLQEFVKKQSDNIKTTDKETKKYYDDNKDKFKQQEQVKGSHIIILINEKVDEKAAEKKINEIYEEVKKGLDFTEAAKKYSEDGSAKSGGDLGYFSKGKMVKEFEDVAFGMKIGEVSKPFKSRFGYHILKLTDKKPKKQLTFEEVKESIGNYLTSQKTKDALEKIVEKNRSSAKIVYEK